MSFLPRLLATVVTTGMMCAARPDGIPGADAEWTLLNRDAMKPTP
jgi:hypothetical protein